jgi:hypothetical protein
MSVAVSEESNAQSLQKPFIIKPTIKRGWVKRIYTILFVLGVLFTLLDMYELSRGYYKDRFLMPDRLVETDSGRGVTTEIKKLEKADPETYKELQTLVDENRDLLKNIEDRNKTNDYITYETKLRMFLGKPQAKGVADAIKRLQSVQSYQGERGIYIISYNLAFAKILLASIPEGAAKPIAAPPSAGSDINDLAKTNSTSQDQDVLRQNERLIQLGEQLKNPDVKMAFGAAQSAFNELAAEYPQNKQFAAVQKAIAAVRTDDQAQKLLNEIKVMTEAAKNNPHNNEIKRGARGALPRQFRTPWRGKIA